MTTYFDWFSLFHEAPASKRGEEANIHHFWGRCSKKHSITYLRLIHIDQNEQLWVNQFDWTKRQHISTGLHYFMKLQQVKETKFRAKNRQIWGWGSKKHSINYQRVFHIDQTEQLWEFKFDLTNNNILRLIFIIL